MHLFTSVTCVHSLWVKKGWKWIGDHLEGLSYTITGQPEWQPPHILYCSRQDWHKSSRQFQHWMVLARSYWRIHLKAFYVHLSLYSCVIVTVAVLVVVRRVAESIIAPKVSHAGHLLLTFEQDCCDCTNCFIAYPPHLPLHGILCRYIDPKAETLVDLWCYGP